MCTLRVSCRLTHPAVRNQRRILQLAAHQLVYHMPMPNLLLEVDSCRDWRLPPADNSSSKSQEKSPPGGGRTQRQKRRKHLLTQLLSEGVYDVVIKALSAWVLVSSLEGVTTMIRPLVQRFILWRRRAALMKGRLLMGNVPSSATYIWSPLAAWL